MDAIEEYSIRIRSALGNNIFAARPEFLLCGSVYFAVLDAHTEYENQDRRRIKREINKAARKASRQIPRE